MTFPKSISVLLFGLVAACSAVPPAQNTPAVPNQEATANTAAPQQARRQGKWNKEPLAPLSQPEQTEVERRFRVATLETAQTAALVTNNADKDVEPTIVATNYYGTDRTTVGFIKMTPEVASPYFSARVHTSSTTNLASWPTSTVLPMPASGLTGVTYVHTADPVLANNFSNSGIAPLRVYCAGLAYNMSGSGSHPNGGIYVWRSDDGGASFPSTTIARVGDASTPRTYDKPAIAVSWNTTNYTPDNNGQNGATIGQVYVAWADVYTPTSNPDNTQHRILFSRSTDGGLSFSTPITIATGFVHAPQVVVPSNTGRVFVLYARYNTANTRTNSIEMMRSTDAGTTFSAPPNNVLSATRMFGPSLSAYTCTDCLANSTNGRSVFQARYNPGVGLQVVWHGEQPNDTTMADVYYAYYNGSWTMSNLTQNTANDQFYPSFDYDASNNAVITWYDRRNDTVTPNRLYQLYFMKINTTGGTLQAAGAASATTNDPPVYTPAAGFVGDYQDTWFHSYSSGGKWVSASVRINGTGSGDIIATQITP